MYKYIRVLGLKPPGSLKRAQGLGIGGHCVEVSARTYILRANANTTTGLASGKCVEGAVLDGFTTNGTISVEINEKHSIIEKYWSYDI